MRTVNMMIRIRRVHYEEAKWTEAFAIDIKFGVGVFVNNPTAILVV